MRSYARLCVIGNYHQGGSRQRECPVAVDLKQRDGFMKNSYSNEYCFMLVALTARQMTTVTIGSL